MARNTSISLLATMILLTTGCVCPGRCAGKVVRDEHRAPRIVAPIELEVHACIAGSPEHSPESHPLAAMAASELRSLAGGTGRFVVKGHPYAARIWGEDTDSCAGLSPKKSLVAEIQYLDVGTRDETLSLLAADASTRLSRLTDGTPDHLFFSCGVNIDLVERLVNGTSQTICAGQGRRSLSFPAHTFDIVGMRDSLEASAGREAGSAGPASNEIVPARSTAGTTGGGDLHRVVADTVEAALADLIRCVDERPYDNALDAAE
jgi:hypothetical protein